ncbi:MAG TPA: hypothetical protein VIO84_08455 [Candidatus Dormibacteraeota bacterium]|jgi:hypothetical protein
MQLLLGEPQTSAEADDIVHWRDVYSELTSCLRASFDGCAEDSPLATGMKTRLLELVDRYAFWSDLGPQLVRPGSGWSLN